MNSRTKKILVVITSAGLLVLLILVASAAYVLHSIDSALNAGQYPHRPDAEMIRTFYAHRSEFEEVRAMATADSVLRRVDEDWSDPVNLSQDKLSRYRALFRVIETPRGISKYGDGKEIEFLASTLGWVASGSIKGYVYTEQLKPRGEVVDSLDDPTSLRVLQTRYLKRIEGDWYLYFER